MGPKAHITKAHTTHAVQCMHPHPFFLVAIGFLNASKETIVCMVGVNSVFAKVQVDCRAFFNVRLDSWADVLRHDHGEA